jgi:serine/threonine protein kinase
VNEPFELFGGFALYERIGFTIGGEVFLASRIGDSRERRLEVVRGMLPLEELANVSAWSGAIEPYVGFEHPSISRLIEARVLQRRPCAIYERTNGVDLEALAQRCSRRGVQVPIELALYVGVELLRALEWVHGAGLLHLALMPSSVRIGKDGAIKLLELGWGATLSTHGTVEETPRSLRDRYLCPEQIIGGTVDHRADLFSAAVIIWELIAGRKLFQADSTFEVLFRIRDARVPTALTSIRSVPESIDRELRRALSKEPGARHGSAKELREALESVAHRSSASEVRSFIESLSGGTRSIPPRAVESEHHAPVVQATELPPELKPWAAQLSELPPDLALGLGRSVRKVSRAIGPLRVPSRSIHGEPDGYDGLVRRGPFERLLSSEWLLAMEIEDEFLRRAVSGEQAFFALARREPSGSRRSIALFDAGPSSIGTPRVAHLATLIALAARAESGGARFAWGIIQDDRRSQVAEVSRASVLRLLEARSASEASPKDAADWIGQLGTPQEADDLWIVGGRRAHALFGAASSRITIEEPFEQGPAPLSLEINRTGYADRRMELELPPQPDCVRLLRDPFRVRVTRPVRGAPELDPKGDLYFSPDGKRLMVHLADGGLVAFPVPNSPRAPPGRPTIFRHDHEGGEISGATWHDRRLHLLEVAEGSAFLLRTGARGRLTRTWRADPMSDRFVSARGRLLPLAVMDDRVLALDASRRLHTYELKDDRLEFEGAADRVTGFVSRQNLAAYFQAPDHTIDPRQGGRGKLYVARRGEVQIDLGLEIGGSGDFRFVHGARGFGAAPYFGPVAIRVESGAWAVPLLGGIRWIEAPRSGRVIGVRLAPTDGAPGLIVLEDDERSFSWRGDGRDDYLWLAVRRVVATAMSPVHPQVACLLEDGELIVRDFTEGVVLRTKAGGWR